MILWRLLVHRIFRRLLWQLQFFWRLLRQLLILRRFFLHLLIFRRFLSNLLFFFSGILALLQKHILILNHLFLGFWRDLLWLNTWRYSDSLLWLLLSLVRCIIWLSCHLRRLWSWFLDYVCLRLLLGDLNLSVCCWNLNFSGRFLLVILGVGRFNFFLILLCLLPFQLSFLFCWLYDLPMQPLHCLLLLRFLFLLDSLLLNLISCRLVLDSPEFFDTLQFLGWKLLPWNLRFLRSRGFLRCRILRLLSTVLVSVLF